MVDYHLPRVFFMKYINSFQFCHNRAMQSDMYIYVIDRHQGSCGVWDIPMVLRGGAELPQGYHIHHSFRGVYVARTIINCLPPITG